MSSEVENMKERVWQCKNELDEKMKQIQMMEQELSNLQQSEDQQLLKKLQSKNEQLQNMVDLQKKSLFHVLTGSIAMF